MNYYERHIGDYLRDTAHLSLLEHGIYTRLLDIYYTRESSIPKSEAARLVGARTKEEREALASVLAEFFADDGAAYRQERCEREIARLQAKRKKASESASLRWAMQCERNANASQTHMRTSSEDDANAMRTHCEGNARAPVPSLQTPDTIPEEKDPPASRPPPKTKGSRLPNDWEPGPLGVEFAAAEGLRNGRAAAELAKFRDYWVAQPGQKGVKTDWLATWRNWCRKAADSAPQAQSFRERDTTAKAERVREMTGGLLEQSQPRKAIDGTVERLD